MFSFIDILLFDDLVKNGEISQIRNFRLVLKDKNGNEHIIFMKDIFAKLSRMPYLKSLLLTKENKEEISKVIKWIKMDFVMEVVDELRKILLQYDKEKSNSNSLK